MKKVIVMMIGWLSLFVSGFAEAQVIKTGVIYSGGAQLELAGSGATFTVPAGWSGQYNPAEKIFEMGTPMGDESVAVGYEGKSYSDAVTYAKKPVRILGTQYIIQPLSYPKVQSKTSAVK